MALQEHPRRVLVATDCLSEGINLQSGFNAVRHHLLRYRRERTGALFRESVGPLVTPRRVIEALMSGAIDVGPLDSYVHDLLKVHEPATVGALRTVETTVMTPMPLLVASAQEANEAGYPHIT